MNVYIASTHLDMPYIYYVWPTYYIDNRFTLSSKLKKVPIPKKTRKVVA